MMRVSKRVRRLEREQSAPGTRYLISDEPIRPAEAESAVAALMERVGPTGYAAPYAPMALEDWQMIHDERD